MKGVRGAVDRAKLWPLCVCQCRCVPSSITECPRNLKTHTEKHHVWICLKAFRAFRLKSFESRGLCRKFSPFSFNFLFPLYFVIVTLFDLFACHLFPYIVLYFPLILIRCSFIRMKGLLSRCRLCLINIGSNVDIFNAENDEISYVQLLHETLQIEVHFVK